MDGCDRERGPTGADGRALGASALLLVGHGSARNANSSAPTRRLAWELTQRAVFAEVAACFWKETPFLASGLTLVRADDVFVVPNFAGEGYFTREVIPRELGLSGTLTVTPPPGPEAGPTEVGRRRRVHYLPPVGAHPRIAAMVLRRAGAVAAAAGLDPGTTGLLLVGHGSSRPGGSADTAEALAATVRTRGPFPSVRTAYLEQAPLVSAWPSVIPDRDVIVMPLLIAEGLHGAEDLPPLFGLAVADVASTATAGRPATGPSTAAGRRVWLCRGIGSDPEIVEVILDLVGAAAAPDVSPGKNNPRGSGGG